MNSLVKLTLLVVVLAHFVQVEGIFGVKKVCDGTTFRCNCGRAGQFEIQKDQCLHFYKWEPYCKPCDDSKEETTCPLFNNCLECSTAVLDRCVSCPPNRFGTWCTGECQCQNGGVCNRNGICECPSNYVGINCEKPKVALCPAPMELPNGSIEGLVGEEGTTVTYRCDEGFVLHGNSVRTCKRMEGEHRGMWVGETPTCVPICKDPTSSDDLVMQAIYDSSVISEGKNIVKQLLFSCKDHKRLIGAKSVSCIAPDIWNAPFPICVPGCLAPVAPQNGIAQQISNLPKKSNGSRTPEDEIKSSLLELGYSPVNTLAVYFCKSHYYVLKGSAKRYCRQNGQWSGRQPTCVSVCGQYPGIKFPTIANGNVSSVGRWPWQAAIVVKDSKGTESIVCGGALLSERWVLSAAHCVTRRGTTERLPLKDIRVALGKHYRNDSLDDKLVQKRRVKNLLVHETFQPISFDSDLVLIELSKDVKFTSRVQPICLPDAEYDEDLLHEGSMGVVTGWGENENGIVASSLTETSLPVRSRETCQQSYERSGITVQITDNMFCAGADRGTLGTCSGDSGGPMVFRTGTGADAKYELLGIVSWQSKYGCANPGQYAGFVKITNFLRWINDNID